MGRCLQRHVDSRRLIPLGLDFETFYSREYTLSKLTTSEYILDPRFEIIGAGLALGGVMPVWFSGDLPFMKRVLGKIPWDRTLCICHNAIFDGSILEWILGFQPAKYFCTMMASRPFVAPYTGRSSLSKVLEFYPEIGVRKGDYVVSAAGKHRADFSAQELADYGNYCSDDTLGSARLYEKFKTMLPDDEADLIDLTIKKFTRPKLKLSVESLRTRIDNIVVEKQELVQQLASMGVTEAELRSRVRFAKVLEEQGITVPKKLSKAKDPLGNARQTFAFSKTDAEFMELLAHDSQIVRDLVAARLRLASNMEETRLARLADIAHLDFAGDTLLPVPLLYYGAHTGRFSGLDKINLQNLPRIKYLGDGKTQDPESGWLRRSIIAPDGHVIIAADLSNIEARIVATLAGQHDMVEGFRRGEDLYSYFASRIYGRPVNKKDNPDERFVGKTCILGLGYGMGWMKFLLQMVLAKAKGIDAVMAKKIIYLYRDTYANIPNLWSVLEQYLMKCMDPSAMFTYGPLTFLHERILLPNGLPIVYPGLRVSATQRKLVFTNRRSGKEYESTLWGGAITENVVQALARIILTRAELKLARHGLLSALQVHDELVYCVPEKHAAACKKAIALALCAPVDFMPLLPVACEVGIGKTYAECK